MPSPSPFTFTPSAGGTGDFEVVPAGNHKAICVALVDLGTHTTEYKGKVSDSRKIMLVWELVGQMDSEGKPFVYGETFTWYEKPGQKSAFRQFLESWRGAPLKDGEQFDPLNLLGKKCLLNLIHETKTTDRGERTYAALHAIAPPPEGLQYPTPFLPEFFYHVSLGAPNVMPDWLPRSYGKTVMEVLKSCKEFAGQTSQPASQPVQNGNGVHQAPAGVETPLPASTPF